MENHLEITECTIQLDYSIENEKNLIKSTEFCSDVARPFIEDESSTSIFSFGTLFAVFVRDGDSFSVLGISSGSATDANLLPRVARFQHKCCEHFADVRKFLVDRNIAGPGLQKQIPK
jgi:hypothetical protein